MCVVMAQSVRVLGVMKIILCACNRDKDKQRLYSSSIQEIDLITGNKLNSQQTQAHMQQKQRQVAE